MNYQAKFGCKVPKFPKLTRMGIAKVILLPRQTCHAPQKTPKRRRSKFIRVGYIRLRIVVLDSRQLAPRC